MQLLQQYFQIKKDIFKYFGYDSGFFPKEYDSIQDNTSYYWIKVNRNSYSPKSIIWSEKEFTEELVNAGSFYQDYIDEEKIGENYTLFYSNNEKYIYIFSNNLEIINPYFEKIYLEYW